MPLLQVYRENGASIGVWKVDEDINQLLALLDNPTFYREEMIKFNSSSRRHEWLAVRVLLKTLCGMEKEINYYPSGKPFLKDGSGFVSISHTRGYVAVALHSSCEVGVDIEQYSERVKKVASRFVCPDEWRGLIRGDEIYGLLLHWSAKETLFKVMGMEEVDFIRHLHIFPFVQAESGVFEACECRTEMQCHYLIHYQVHSDFVLTWTVK